MKILHVTYSDNYGGANIAATRVHKSLLNSKKNSYLVVIDKKLNLKNTVEYKYFLNSFSRKLRPYLEKIFIYIMGLKKKASLNILSSNLSDYANKQKFDIINLHWINNEMMSLKELENFDGKIVWTLHDAWPIEDFFHYPEIKYPFSKNFFISKILSLLKKKKKFFLNKKKINIVCPSHWIKNYAINNSILKINNSIVIRNPINLKFWKPIKLKKNKKRIILFGSVDVNSDTRKGLNNFLKKLNKISKHLPNFKLCIFGSNQIKYSNLNFEVENLGFLNSKGLRYYYNKSDVYVVTSKQDNLPNTAIEAMSCGTPVITVSNNGLKEIILNKKNGYVISNFSDNELKKSLQWSFGVNRKNFIHSSIKKQFSEIIISKEYYNYYNKI